MALLSHHRRFWAFGILTVLLLPLFGLVLPDMSAPAGPVDRLPKAFWQRATERVDPFINGNFGFRGVLMAAHRLIAKGNTKQGEVLIGEAGQLFYTGDQAIELALGLFVRLGRPLNDLERVARAMSDLQASRGGRFLLASPPDVATIQADRLPQWLRVQQRHPNNYDLAMTRLTRVGVDVVDFRPLLLEAKVNGPSYSRTDTHWNNFGALLAFNAAMQKMSRADMMLDPARYLGPLMPALSGSLARMAGQTQDREDQDYVFKDIDWVAQDITAISFPASSGSGRRYAFATGRKGPSILVIGDSFTENFWKGLMAQKSSRFAWFHHGNCRFAWGWIENFSADLLIYAPTERYLGCEGLPRNFPARARR